ncbi:MAG: tripartite tricarboxylate transporter substrate binding protein [Xanthobacteraceae bacterium]|nr:tripartite tricarboxylate transporter substrate binding protein [Xanthobacteraceae bacterium]
MLDRRRFTKLGTASTLLTAIGSPALAQAWPNRIVRLVVPFTPGGGIDGVGRIIGARLSEIWGQQVVVENKPGAGANIGIEFVARAAPDGYTMLITAGGLTVNQYLFPSINYDPVADFAPVTLICTFPNLLAVPKDSKFRSVGDILAAAKANPGKLTYASPGHGSSPHMSAELFKYMAKVDITHVPYRGAAPAITDLVAGRVDMTFAVMASGLPMVAAGQLRALGVSTAKRQEAAPDVPAIGEAGVPGYDTSSWFAFVVPAKTPPDVIRKMNADTLRVLAEPAVKARLDKLGVIIVGSTPEALGAHLKEDAAKWGPVIKAANIKVTE